MSSQDHVTKTSSSPLVSFKENNSDCANCPVFEETCTFTCKRLGLWFKSDIKLVFTVQCQLLRVKSQVYNNWQGLLAKI